MAPDQTRGNGHRTRPGLIPCLNPERGRCFLRLGTRRSSHAYPMTLDPHDIHLIFCQAIDLPESQRRSFVEQRCTDPNARAAVLALLEKAASAGGFLEKPATDTFASLAGFNGEQFEHFRIVREIGRGGMGVVYLADDTRLGRKVAIKFLQRGAVNAAVDAAGVLREARLVAKLSHPHIVNVFSAGEDSRSAYIVMEYVDGRTLREIIGPPLPPGNKVELGARPPVQAPVAAALLRDIAEALDHAHRHGVIHRDVKPSNILIDQDGRPKLTDFGVARADQETTIAGATEVAGSLPYMSPEQAKVRTTDIDHRTDVFSLGVVLYECLTGTRPFEGVTPQQTLRALAEFEAPPIRQAAPGVPRDLAVICYKAIEKHPRDRYQTAAHMAADLRAFLAGDPILARPPDRAERLWRWTRRHRRMVAATVLLGLVIATTILGQQRWRAYQDSRAMLSVLPKDSMGDCSVTVERWNATQEFRAAPVSLGAIPVLDAALEPGVYRITIRHVSGASVEADELLEAGRHHSISVWNHGLSTDASGMVRVEGGSHRANYYSPFEGQPNASGRTPLLGSYWIDVAEVTNEQYKTFLDATGGTPPSFWTQVPNWSEIAQRPVVDITREQRSSYARWAGKRLPTAYEWWAAAQAPDGRARPWGSDAVPSGEEPTAEMLAADQDRDDGRQVDHYLRFVKPAVQPITALSPSGLAHVFGNIMEMSGTVVTASQGSTVAVMGGYWATHPKYADLRTTALYPASARSTQIGFRCVKSVSSPSSHNPQPGKTHGLSD